jgi:hypothetical protein
MKNMDKNNLVTKSRGEYVDQREREKERERAKVGGNYITKNFAVFFSIRLILLGLSVNRGNVKWIKNYGWKS